jgi:Protein of unknown function (DUF5672)
MKPGFLSPPATMAARLRDRSVAASPKSKCRLEQGAKAKKLVAIVTPVYRLPLSADEEISLQHLRHYLSEHDLFLIAPESLLLPDEMFPKADVIRFPDRFFTGTDSYSRLMLSPEFYSCFESYEYILIYQLDCLVLSGDLRKWCERDFDYIGAPWFKGHSSDPAAGLWRVGNGGLSLRRVSSFVAVLTARGLWASPRELAEELDRLAGHPRLRKLLVWLRALLFRTGYKNTIADFIRNFPENEDWFWGLYAPQACPDFRIPTAEEALSFAFECAPRYCFAKNGNRLPFGCHGWYKIDRPFWQQFLLPGSGGEADRRDLAACMSNAALRNA